MPTFIPPTQDTVMNYTPDADWVAKALGRHFKLRAGGVTVLKEDGTYRMKRFPTIDEIAAADAAYLGGHIYEVDEDEATALVAAGYVVT